MSHHHRGFERLYRALKNIWKPVASRNEWWSHKTVTLKLGLNPRAQAQLLSRSDHSLLVQPNTHLVLSKINESLGSATENFGYFRPRWLNECGSPKIWTENWKWCIGPGSFEIKMRLNRIMRGDEGKFLFIARKHPMISCNYWFHSNDILRPLCSKYTADSVWNQEEADLVLFHSCFGDIQPLACQGFCVVPSKSGVILTLAMIWAIYYDEATKK